MTILNINDLTIPVTRLRFSHEAKKLVEVKSSTLFLKGPIPLDWISAAAGLPGKALPLGIALWWLEGMSKGGGIKMTKIALAKLNVSRDAYYDGLKRLEAANLISVTREPGKKPHVFLVRQLTKNRAEIDIEAKP